MMALSGSQIQQIHQALLSAYSSEESLDQMVRFELDRRRPEIAGGRNLSDIVLALIDWAERNGRVADLLRGAYKQNPTNPEIQQLFSTLRAERTEELLYLEELIADYHYWTTTYTPLAGVVEVATTRTAGPQLALPADFMPAEFVKLAEHGFGAHRQVERVPVEDLREAVQRTDFGSGLNGFVRE